MNRRDFVLSGAATTSLSLFQPASLALAGVTDGAAGRIALHKVVYDPRFAASAAFGAAAARSGAPTATVAGDITSLWYADLSPHWTRGEGPLAVAGMTTPQALLGLEMMARDHWLKVVVRAEHAPGTPAGTRAGVQHRVTAAQAALAPAVRILNTPDWPSGMARLLTACPADRAGGARARVVSDAAGTGPQVDLVSWIISA